MTSHLGILFLIIGLSHAQVHLPPEGHIPGGPNLSAGNLCDLTDATTLVGEVTLSQAATLFEGFGSSAASKEYFIAGLTTNGFRRSLLKFDLDTVGFPADVQVLCAEIRLSLNMDLSSSDAAPSEITLHQVTKDWTTSPNGSSFQEELNGSEAKTGDVTWEYSSYPTERWNTMGGDFGGETLSRQQKTVKDGNEYEWFGNTKRMHLVVDQWIKDASSNHGVLIKSGEAPTDAIAYNVYHGAQGTTGVVPKLMVVYTSPLLGFAHKVAQGPNVPTTDDILNGTPPTTPPTPFDDMMIGIPTDNPTTSPVMNGPGNMIGSSSSDSDSDSDSEDGPFGFQRDSNSNQEYTAIAVSITGLGVAATIATMFGLIPATPEAMEKEEGEGDGAMFDSVTPPEVV